MLINGMIGMFFHLVAPRDVLGVLGGLELSRLHCDCGMSMTRRPLCSWSVLISPAPRQDDVSLLFGLVLHTYELFSAIG